ncbi:MAG: BlaI/MecI/CopY family transcriptional regulator [Chloroflexi bacterium]|nr:BlaI/MecI/CopY family transcriptional regulator [Chloroflexota bacterium]
MPARSYTKITRRAGKGAEKFLGELELAIMNVAWARESVTVRDVVATLKKRRPAYTTIMTVMGRLAQKGLLTQIKEGKAHVYRAALTREAFETQAAGAVVHSLLADFGDIALAQIVKELSQAGPDQLARLAELARAAREEKGDA